MSKGYDKEVWFFLRTIWESVPKISFVELCELVAEITNKPLPSPDSVRKKCKAEKWTKRIRSYCQKSDGNLKVIKCRLLDEVVREYEKIQKDTEEMAAATNGALVVHGGMPEVTFKALESIAYINRKTVDVVRENRIRFGKLGQLLDDSMNWMYEAKEIALKDDQSEEDVQKAQRRFNLIEAFVEKLEVMSRTAKNIWTQEVTLYGIREDDTRDAESTDRMATLQDDSIFDGARQSLDEQFNEMMRRAQYIQNGGFEDEVLAEQAAKEKAEQLQDALEHYPQDDEDSESY